MPRKVHVKQVTWLSERRDQWQGGNGYLIVRTHGLLFENVEYCLEFVVHVSAQQFPSVWFLFKKIRERVAFMIIDFDGIPRH
jgi:hypothetical protein